TARGPPWTSGTSRSGISSDVVAPPRPVRRAPGPGRGQGGGARLPDRAAGAGRRFSQAGAGGASHAVPGRRAGGARGGGGRGPGRDPRRAVLRRPPRRPRDRLRLLRYAPGADTPRDHPRSRRTGRQPVAHRHPVVRRARGLPAVGPMAAAVPRQASRGSGGPAGAARPDRRDPLVAGGDPGRAPRARAAPPLRRRAPRGRSGGSEAVNPFERTLLNVSTGLVAL